MAAIDELRPQIVREWDRWSAEGGANGLLGFEKHLQTQRPELLDFRAAGRKEQKIREILERAGRL